MEAQNYSNHRRFVPMYNIVLFGLIVLTLIGSLVNLYQSLGDHQRLYSASLIVVLTISLLMLSFLLPRLSFKGPGPCHPRRRKPASLRAHGKAV